MRSVQKCLEFPIVARELSMWRRQEKKQTQNWNQNSNQLLLGRFELNVFYLLYVNDTVFEVFVLLFVFSIPLTLLLLPRTWLELQLQVEAADTTCLVKVRCLTEDHLAFGNNLSQAKRRWCQKAEKQICEAKTRRLRWASNMLPATLATTATLQQVHQRNICWERLLTAKRKQRAQNVDWKRKYYAKQARRGNNML